MSKIIKMELKDILKMPVEDRIKILEQIWESIAPEDIEIPDSQREEVENRIVLHHIGKAAWLNYDQAREKLNRKVN